MEINICNQMGIYFIEAAKSNGIRYMVYGISQMRIWLREEYSPRRKQTVK